MPISPKVDYRYVQLIKTYVRQFIDTFLPVSNVGSWSQCGEDAVLRHHIYKSFGQMNRWRALLNWPRFRKGFYVDIGAFSPRRFSNTYFLYRQGWRGITIEPNAQVAWAFRWARPRDIHISTAIGKADEPIRFRYGGYSALNQVVGRESDHSADAKAGVVTVPCRRLSSVLEEYLARGSTVDLLSIDCEGADLDVLESNDWDRFPAGVVVVEDFAWRR
jgi:FkbM family methyltransferase